MVNFNTTYGIQAENPYSLLSNSGFESGDLTGFNNWNNGITDDPSLVYEGDYSAYIKGGQSGSVQVYTSLKPNTPYRISLYAHVNQTGDEATLIARYFNGSASKITKKVTATSFSEYSIDFTTGGDPSEVMFSLYKANAASGEVYLDNYVLYETGDQVTEINLSGADDCGLVIAGESYQLSAEILPITALNQNLNWSVVPGSGAATIAPSGLVTGVSEGSVEVLATAQDGSGVTQSFPLNIVESLPEPGSISFGASPPEGELNLGSTFQFTANIEPEIVCDKTVVWYLQEAGGSATISETGVLKALQEGLVIVGVHPLNYPELKKEMSINLVLGERSNYYVDATNGDDLRDGLSPNNAWKSLSKVNGSTFMPGDSVLFKNGEIWSGQLEIETTGLKEYPVVFASYGIGEKPRIDGNGQKDYTVLLKNSDYTEVNGFEVTNTGSSPAGGRYGVMMLASNVGSVYGTAIRNMEVHHVNGDVVKSNGGGGGIVWKIEGETPSRFVNGLIEGNHIYDCQRNGIVGKSDYSSNPYQKLREYYSLRMKIRQNLIERIPGDGIVLLGCDSSTVEYNICRDFTTDLPDGDAAAGIWPWNSLNSTIQHNEVSGHMGGWDGQGFDSDWNCENTIIQYNYSHYNAGGFILICSKGSVGYNDNTIVRYNISVNDGFRTWGNGADFCPTFHLAGNIYNTQIYNNTIYTDAKPASVEKSFTEATHWEAWPDETHIYNNIFYAADASEFIMGSSTNNYFSNNLYSPNTILPPDEAPLLADPKFVNSSEGTSPEDFRLADGSVAFGRGRIVSENGGEDYFGNPVSDSAAPTIGAFQGTVVTVPMQWSANDKELLFSVFPNPAKEGMVCLESSRVSGDALIMLTTLTGRVLETKSYSAFDQTRITFDIHAYRAGMYLITIRAGEIVETHKLIKF